MAPSIVTQYALETLSDTELALTLTTSFVPQDTPARAPAAEREAHRHVHQRGAARGQLGGPGADDRGPRRYDERDDARRSKYQSLNPENYAALPLRPLQSGLQFGESLLSCKVRDGEARFTAEGECGWAAAFGSSGEQEATDSSNGYRRDVRTISIGSQWSVSDNWHLGLAAAFERDQIDSATLANLRLAGSRKAAPCTRAWCSRGTSVRPPSRPASRRRVATYDTHRSAFLALHGSQSEQQVYQTALQFRVSHGFE